MKPRKTYHQLFFIFLFVFCSGYLAEAQKADSATYYRDKIYYWGGFHIGAGSYLINTGLDAGMLLKNAVVIAVKTDLNDNITFFSPPHRTIEADESALLLGLKLTHHRYSNWIVLSGISYIWMKDRGDVIGNKPGFFGGNIYGDDKVYSGAGVPVVLKYTLTPVPAFAMDFSAGANINPHRNFFSITFGLAFGKVRSGAAHPPGGSRPDPFSKPPWLLKKLGY